MGMEIKEIERRLSFVLREREALHGGDAPLGCSRICVSGGHQMVLSGGLLFLDGRLLEEDVVYLSRWMDVVVATRRREAVVFDFARGVVRRMAAEYEMRRCEVWKEHVGILFADGRLRVFKDGKSVLEKSSVGDFVLPDLVVSGGVFKDHKGVERIFRGCASEVVVTDARIGKDVENALHRGDLEYSRDAPPCYYHCCVEDVDVVASSNSSRFVLLGRGQELELEEEIKLLGLRSDEDFNVKYLTGMDYSAGSVYLIDEDGFVSRFEVCGLGDLQDEGRDVEFAEERYRILDSVIEREEEQKPSLSMGSLLEAAEEKKEETTDAIECRPAQRTGDARIDALLQGVEEQTDRVIADFGRIRVDRRRFRMYKHNTNDMSLFMEQVYRNTMRLDGYRSLEKEMEAQLTYMLESLEMYRGMDEENIRSTVRYFDSVIEGVSGQRRRPVHYTQPLFCSIEKVKAIRPGLSSEGMETRSTLSTVDCVEKRLEKGVDEEIRHVGIGDSLEARQNVAEMTVGKTEPEPVQTEQRIETASMDGLQTNIFGQAASQQIPVQFGGVFQSSSASSIFDSIASSPVQLPQTAPREEEGLTPNAFSRFASSRSLFK